MLYKIIEIRVHVLVYSCINIKVENLLNSCFMPINLQCVCRIKLNKKTLTAKCVEISNIYVNTLEFIKQNVPLYNSGETIHMLRMRDDVYNKLCL